MEGDCQNPLQGSWPPGKNYMKNEELQNQGSHMVRKKLWAEVTPLQGEAVYL